MKRICPNPKKWHDFYKELLKISNLDSSVPDPPVPIILGGWWSTGDFEKALQWDATLRWINTYGGTELLSKLTDEDFYQVIEYGRPCGERWNVQTILPAPKYPINVLTDMLQRLERNWNSIAGDIAHRCKPACFSGRKSRCLKVQIFDHQPPPWGTWGIGVIRYRDVAFIKKSEFTKFRQRINKYLAPHEVDHIDFFYKKI